MQFSLLWWPIWSKRTLKCVNGDEMFLSTILLKHPPSINHVLHINYDTSGGLYRTFYGIRNTQFLSIFLVVRVQKLLTGCGVNVQLYQNMSNLLINYDSVSARPRF